MDIFQSFVFCRLILSVFLSSRFSFPVLFSVLMILVAIKLPDAELFIDGY